MNPFDEYRQLQTRRHFFGSAATGIGTAALASLLGPDLIAGEASRREAEDRGVLGAPHFAPKAKRVIYMFMSGAPSQIDLLDHNRNSTSCSIRICPIRCGRDSGSRR